MHYWPVISSWRGLIAIRCQFKLYKSGIFLAGYDFFISPFKSFSLLVSFYSFPGEKKALSEYGPGAAAANDDDDDDDFELFGDDDEEEDAAAAKLKEERIAAYTAKKDKSKNLFYRNFFNAYT